MGIGLLAVLLIGGAVWGLRTSSFNWLIGSQTKAASTDIVQSMADLNADGARVPPPSGDLKSVTTTGRTFLDGDASIGIAAPNPADVHLKTVSIAIEPAQASIAVEPGSVGDPHETTGDGITVNAVNDAPGIPVPADYDGDGITVQGNFIGTDVSGDGNGVKVLGESESPRPMDR